MTNGTDLLQRERQILLDLGNDITRMREKSDLIILFSKRLKELFYFTHTIVTLIDYKDDTYTPFLLDIIASPVREHHAYTALINARFPLNSPFIQAVLAADGPVSFILEDVMDLPHNPAFLRMNYEGGIREILMTTLMNAGKPMGFIHNYSDRPGSFTAEFTNIIKGIVPQLSGAVSNIIKNEELLQKEQEKSFLLDLSNDIATVRTKDDLAAAVRTALDKIDTLRGYVIRRINDDRATMSTYIYDDRIIDGNDPDLQKINSARFPIQDGLQNRVLDSYIPLLFSIDLEIQRGITSPYLLFWKKMGFKVMVGVPLRNGNVKLGILWLGIEEVNIPLLQGICAQISVALANIMANEEVVSKQRVQSFLLQFSNEMAGIRTKDDLEQAIRKVLDNILGTRLAMINLMDEDGVGLTPYMYDQSLFEKALANFAEMMAIKLTVREEYTARLLQSGGTIVFHVAEELERNKDNGFPRLWRMVGYENMYAARLHTGNHTLGTLWLLSDEIDMGLFTGICSQISVAIANIQANEKVQQYKRRLEEENDYLKEQIRSIYNFSEIIGSGEAMQKVYHLMSLVAEATSTVLILGETGTGKELIARALHNASPRRDKLMVKVNCAAMPANLIESELFGHERGAFTGALERRIGKFELANGSTLFLDEIGEMPLEAQAKLLRVIQERELERVGGKNTIKIDVRIIAATNRNLEEEVKAGRFRSDLYYRLNVFPIVLPPLRERAEDIEPLTHFFLAKFSKNTGKKVNKVAAKVMHQLNSYLWPGNVRELEHLVERSVLLATDHVLREIHLPEYTERSKPAEMPVNRTLEEMERTYIIEVLRRCSGKISGAGGAAEVLNIPGNTLHSKMKKLSIGKADYFS